MRSSGLSDEGKNCRGTEGSAMSATTKQADVTTMVSQRMRIAPMRTPRKMRATKPGSGGGPGSGFLSSTTPISGIKITATSHDASTAMLTTAKIENVYSPAVLFAKPIGTKPAIVTNDPVSIGNASVR